MGLFSKKPKCEHEFEFETTQETACYFTIWRGCKKCGKVIEDTQEKQHYYKGIGHYENAFGFGVISECKICGKIKM